MATSGLSHHSKSRRSIIWLENFQGYELWANAEEEVRSRLEV